MCLSLLAKLGVSSIILTSFRRVGYFTPLHTPQNEPLKRPPRLGLNGKKIIESFFEK